MAIQIQGSTIIDDSRNLLTVASMQVKGSSTGYTTVTSANTSAANYTLTLPAASTYVPIVGQQITISGPTTARTYTFPDTNATLATTNATQTWTSTQTFLSNGLRVNGSSTGYTTFASANASATNYTLTVPAVNGTVITSGDTGTVTSVMLQGSIPVSKIVGAATPDAANAFTGANTFYNATGQTFGTATVANDGILLTGRAGGTGTYRVTLQPAVLSGTRTITLPDNTGTIITTGTTGALTTGIVKNTTSTGALSIAIAGTDYVDPNGNTEFSGTQIFQNTGLRIKGSSTGNTAFASSNASTSNYTLTFPAVTATIITSGDTGTVTNTMLAGSIATSKITGLAPSATTDATNADNISTGYIAAARGGTGLNSAGWTGIVKVSSGSWGTAIAGTDYLIPGAIGNTIQAYSANLTTWAGKTAPVDEVVGTTGAQTLSNKTLAGYTESVYSLTGTVLAATNGNIQYKTLAANTTFTETIADGQSITLLLNPSTFTTTWPTITWLGGTAPTLTASKFNVVVLFQVNAVLYGVYSGALI